jgi:hypothetical protein
VASAFLFIFGTGPVRGFAVTLGIGLAANLFTAVFVSRAIFDVQLWRRPHMSRLSFGSLSSNMFRQDGVDFMRRRLDFGSSRLFVGSGFGLRLSSAVLRRWNRPLIQAGAVGCRRNNEPGVRIHAQFRTDLHRAMAAGFHQPRTFYKPGDGKEQGAGDDQANAAIQQALNKVARCTCKCPQPRRQRQRLTARVFCGSAGAHC